MRAAWVLVGFLGASACSDKQNIGDDGVEPPPVEPAISGMALYHSMRCANCHGVDGRGSGVFPGAPNLIGRTADDIRAWVREPCEDPNRTNDCHPLKIPDLTDDQITKLAAYILELGGGATVANPGPPCDTVPGNICTVAGNGISGNQRGATGLKGRETYLFWPQNVSEDPQGRIIITDWNNFLLRRLEKEGCVAEAGTDGDCPITTVYGNGELADECSQPGRPVMSAEHGNNHNITVEFDEYGHMIMGGWHMWKIKYIEMVNGDPARVFCMFGNVRGFAGDGQAAGYNELTEGPVRFNLPAAAVTDLDGNWYIADQSNVRIRKVNADADDYHGPDAEQYVASRQNNIIDTWIGGPLEDGGYARRTLPDYSDSGDGGPVGEASIAFEIGFDATPQARLAFDKVRNLMYIADSNNSRIRVVDMSQDPPIIDTFAGGGDILDGPNLHALDVELRRPADVDLIPDGTGDILITDTFNHCVRRVSYETRIVTTIAGVCSEEEAEYAGDGGPATEARLYEPGGSYMRADGTLYIADTINHRIRRVNPK